MNRNQITAGASSTVALRRATWLERGLRLFGDVRPGEGAGALALAFTLFLLLTAYYLLKPARDGLLAASGLEGLTKAELKAYASLAQGLVLFLLVPLYSRVAMLWPRRKLLARVNLFFASHLLVFWLFQPGILFDQLGRTGIAFYIWVGVFNLAVLAQFWAFAADLYAEERGKRIFPLIVLGASSGAVFGAALANRIATSPMVPTHALLLLAALLLGGATALLYKVVPEQRKECAAAVPAVPRASSSGDPGPLRLVLTSRYLLAAAIVIVVLNWVSTNGETLLFASVQSLLEQQIELLGLTDAGDVGRFLSDRTTAFYGSFFFWTNSAALVVQALLVSRLVRLGGFGFVILSVPVVAVLSYSAAALVPVLSVLKLLKIAENATFYSVNNTASQLVWLPTSAEVKFKAKALIDTVFVRLGDIMAALTLFLAMHVFQLATHQLYLLNVLLGVVWLAAAVVLVREHRRLTAREPDPIAADIAEPELLAA